MTNYQALVQIPKPQSQDQKELGWIEPNQGQNTSPWAWHCWTPDLVISHKSFNSFLGRAINYLVSVPSLRACHQACRDDEECCYFSYHRSQPDHPDHENCFLFSWENCGLFNLRLTERRENWRTGKLLKCHLQHQYIIHHRLNILK